MSDRSSDFLLEICKILFENKINYWICNGTLLGLIRENRVLPWDNDIDIGVFGHEVDREQINLIFLKDGYRQ